MFISQFSYFTSARSTLQEAFFYQERFVHLFYGSGILAQSRSNSSKPYRTALELINNGTEYLIVDFIEPVLIYIQRFKSVIRNLGINAPRTFHLCKISHATQQCIRNTRRSTTTGSDLRRCSCRARYIQYPCRTSSS